MRLCVLSEIFIRVFFPSGIDFVQMIALKVIHMTSNGSPEEKLRLMFRMYDKDGNGSIDAREMNE